MKHATIWMTVVLMAAAFCGTLVSDASAQTPEQLEQVRAALPAQARVAPTAARKLLIFNLCKGWEHDAIGIGAAALTMLGDTTGAYTSVVSNDIAVFEPENLKQFDAVCFNNTTGALFLPKDLDKLSPEAQQAAREYDALLKQSLLDFVKSGKGIVGIHAATDTFYEWAEYGEMMGGYFSGHPWNEEVGIKVDDPLHALSAAFDALTFAIADEIYQFKEPYTREKLRVLLSLDVTKTAMNKGEAINRSDGDFAVAWVRSYGEGRVYYCSLGHRLEIFTNPTVLQFYLDGIQFALGDLPADTTPSAALSPEYVQQNESARETLGLDRSMRKVATLEYGDGNIATLAIQTAVFEVKDNPTARAALAARLADALSQPGLTPAGRRFLAEQLSLCATDQEIDVLVDMLKDSEQSDLACYALERIPGQAVDAALCDALREASESRQIGLINVLGKRGQSDSAPALLRALRASDSEDVRHAAAIALGKVGGTKAARALKRMDYENDSTYANAYLAAADRLLDAGEADRAARHYKRILKKSRVDSARWAAFVGMMRSKTGKTVREIIAALEGDDPVLQDAANHCVRDASGGTQETNAFASALPGLAPPTQALLIAALSDRGDREAAPAVLSMLESPDADVRLAAIKALATLGDASAVLPLAQAAATAKGAERDEARKSLALLRAADVNDTLAARIGDTDAAVRAELIRATVPRFAVQAVPALLDAAQAGDRAVSVEAYKALTALAEPTHLPQLLDLLVAFPGEEGRKDAERAVSVVARKSEDAPTDVIIARLADADTAARISLLNVLGQIGGDAALQTVRDAATHDDAGVREAAVRALTTWTDSAALEDLLALARTADTETLRILSLRAALRMLEQDSILSGNTSFRRMRSLDKDLALYKEAMELATRPEEKKLVLAGIANVPTPATIKYVESFTADPELAAETRQALDKLNQTGLRAWASHNTDVAHNAVDGVLTTYWDTQASQKAGMWFMVDLGREQTVKQITLRAQEWNYIKEYAVHLSADQVEWEGPVASGSGMATTVIQIAPQKARFIAIEQTGPAVPNGWTIEEIEIE
jgi:hypothetical protein